MRKGDRAYGPYKHRSKWRVVVIGADGIRTAGTYETFEAAKKAISDVNTQAIGRTVREAIDLFMAESTAKHRSQQTVKHRLLGITGSKDRLLKKLTPVVARELFAARAAKTSGDTQFHELASARAFTDWCIGKGWIQSDPFAGIEPTKPRKRGKEQLRIDEARRLLDACLAEKSNAATAVAVALLFGMRASSITDRTVRDLDDDCRVLWIDHDKTDAGDRCLKVPEVLRPRLAALVAGRNGGERLFGSVDRHWVRYHTRRLSKIAGVRVVCPHGLRGTHASLARPAVSVEHVAQSLGHAGPAITRSNYLAPGLERDLDQQAVTAVLTRGKRAPKPFPTEPNYPTP